MKKDVPSFISSDTIFPRRRATTPYTLPRTSAEREKGQCQHLELREEAAKRVLDALDV